MSFQEHHAASWGTWIMKLGMMRWKGQPLKPNPFSPVQRARKFSEVLGVLDGTKSEEDHGPCITSHLSVNSMVIRPAGLPPMVTSKKHFCPEVRTKTKPIVNKQSRDDSRWTSNITPNITLESISCSSKQKVQFQSWHASEPVSAVKTNNTSSRQQGQR